jgi:GNAT superfamily N-acetyltransferase
MKRLLTLSEIEKNPKLLTYSLKLESEEKVTLRPLESKDLAKLKSFLKSVSKKTQKFYNLESFDSKMAKKLCRDINKYDKLRFILEILPSKDIIALFEFSLDIPEGDKKRFLKYKIKLNNKDYCRFAPCISDKYQNKKIGSLIFPKIIKISKKIGRKKIILWGGVLEKNIRAISFYKKNKFKELGKFKDPNIKDQKSLDMVRTI